MVQTKTKFHNLPNGLRYRGFISYSSKDRKQAKWLHRKLEKYRIPHSLIGKFSSHGEIPKKIIPIFRDRDDLRSSSDIESIIAENLAKSQNLIVLCTPNTAFKESWVDREIKIFHQVRKDGEILAVIGKGKPPTCFPSQLLTINKAGYSELPLAADLRPKNQGGDGKTKAIAKLIAGVIGVDFDDLWQREKRRRRNSLILVMGLFILLFAGLASWVVWTKTSTYQVNKIIQEVPFITTGSNYYATEEWTSALTLSGRFAKARALANNQSTTGNKVGALVAISKSLAQRNEVSEAVTILNEALIAIRQSLHNRTMDSYRIYELYQNILDICNNLYSHISVDTIKHILDIIRLKDLMHIPPGNLYKSAIALDMAKVYTKIERTDIARNILLSTVPQTSDNPSDNLDFCIGFALYLGRFGDIPTAESILEAVDKEISNFSDESVFQIPYLYIRIAEVYKEFKVLDKYTKFLNVSITAAKELKGTSEEFDGINYTVYLRSPYPRYYIRSLAKCNQVKYIYEFSKREGYPLYKIDMLREGAETFAKINPSISRDLVNSAIKETDVIYNDNLKVAAYLKIINTTEDLKDSTLSIKLLTGTLKIAKKLPEKYVGEETESNASDKTEYLSEIALLFDAIGYKDSLKTIAYLAEQTSRHITNDPSDYLPQVVKALARSGDFLLARKTAERSNDSEKLECFAIILNEASTQNVHQSQ